VDAANARWQNSIRHADSNHVTSLSIWPSLVTLKMEAEFSTKRTNIISPRHSNTFSDHIATECNSGHNAKIAGLNLILRLRSKYNNYVPPKMTSSAVRSCYIFQLNRSTNSKWLFRFSVPCIFYRSQIKVPNRCK
jgi:hypothetical protein